MVANTLALLSSFPSRIYEILPQRIQQWQQSPCVAEEHGKKLLERIRREQQQARLKLQEMERRFHELEAIIVRAKQQAIKEDEEVPRGTREKGTGSWNSWVLLWVAGNSHFLVCQGELAHQVNLGISLGELELLFNFSVMFILCIHRCLWMSVGWVCFLRLNWGFAFSLNRCVISL